MSEQSTGRPAPVLTGELRAQARTSPGSWLYSIDPGYDPEGGVPPFAVIGAWPVDEHGEPGEFTPNPDYRPSPVSLGLPEPTDPVDSAMQQAATGQRPVSVVLESLRGATVYLVPEADGDLAVYEDGEGSFVPVLTDVRHAPATAPRLRETSWSGLLGLLPDTMAVKINPGSPVSVRIAAAELRTPPDAPDTNGPAASVNDGPVDERPVNEGPVNEGPVNDGSVHEPPRDGPVPGGIPGIPHKGGGRAPGGQTGG